MTHFFQVTKPVFDTIGTLNYQIIRFKIIPRKGDEIVFEQISDTNLEQKKTIIKRVEPSTTGLMKNYYLIEHEIVK